MDTKTGKIVGYDELASAKEEIKKHFTPLTEKEYIDISKIEERLRPEHLALLRFIDTRRCLGAPHGAEIQNAFRLGYRAAISDQKEHT
jgi:hypothetical protein